MHARWSIGVIMHMLVTGLVPWEGQSGAEVHASVVKETSNPAGFKDLLCWFHTSMGVTAECSDLICQMLTVDHKKRPTATQIRAHPYLKGGRVGADVKEAAVAGAKRGARASMATPAKGAQMVASLRAFKEKGLLKRSAMLALSFGMGQDKLEEIGEVNPASVFAGRCFAAGRRVQLTHPPCMRCSKSFNHRTVL